MNARAFARDDGDAADDAARIAHAVAAARAVLLKALDGLIMTRTADLAARRRLRGADPARWGRDEQQELDRLAWRFRRQLPRHLAPRLNPDDPLVREMQRSESHQQEAALSRFQGEPLPLASPRKGRVMNG